MKIKKKTLKGFKVTYDPKRGVPLKIEFIGEGNQVSQFDLGDGRKPVLKCAKCRVIHWEGLDED